MAKYQLASVNSPSVEFEINGVVRESNVIKSCKSHPNFKDPILFLDVMLPEEPAYMPPMNISVRDHRAFGQKPRVGIHVLKDMAPYQIEPRTTKFDPILNIPCECTCSRSQVAQCSFHVNRPLALSPNSLVKTLKTLCGSSICCFLNQQQGLSSSLRNKTWTREERLGFKHLGRQAILTDSQGLVNNQLCPCPSLNTYYRSADRLVLDNYPRLSWILLASQGLIPDNVTSRRTLVSVLVAHQPV